MKASTAVCLALIAASFLLAAYYYAQMPERMASHWNAAGSVDGYAPKFFGLFLMPLLSVALFALFLAIPRIDPLRRNYAKFRKNYDSFVVLLLAFLLYLYALTILWNVGVAFSMPQVLAPAFAVLFYYCGVLIENAKRNWFVGIRTPWTLSSDRVWKRTHALGGKLFKACGVAALLGVVFPDAAFAFVLAPVLAATVFAVVFSYLEFRKEKRARNARS